MLEDSGVLLIEAVSEVNQGDVHVELRYFPSFFCESHRKAKGLPVKFKIYISL